MTMMVGGSPGTIYSETDLTQGKCPILGTKLSVVDPVAGGVKEYVLCKVAASNNLISGQVCTINGAFVVTVAAVAAGNTREDQLGVAITPVTSGTASASTLIWVQIYGRCSVLASTSILPNVSLKVGTTAGQLTTAGAVTASAHVKGIVLIATSNTAGSLTSAMLNYPRYGTYSF